MMALNPLTGTDMLLKSTRFLWLRSLGTSSYKKGKHGHCTDQEHTVWLPLRFRRIMWMPLLTEVVD